MILLLLTGTPVRAEVLSLLTYNVHGLPSFSVSADQRLERIATMARHYDIVLLQETFGFEQVIRDAVESSSSFSGPPPKIQLRQIHGLVPLFIPCMLAHYCRLPASSGLLAMVFRPALATTPLVSRPFSSCNGVLKFSNDCLASKGLLGIAVQFEKGTVHVYTTHLDAGRQRGDTRARAGQLEEIAATIEQLSPAEAVILAGDLNLSRDDSADMTLLERFLGRTGLRDSKAFESPACMFGCAGLDYILYRSGAVTALVHSGDYDNEAREFVSATGEPLSDHPALKVQFGVNRIEPGQASF